MAAAVSVSMLTSAFKTVAVLLLYNCNLSRSNSPNIDRWQCLNMTDCFLWYCTR